MAQAGQLILAALIGLLIGAALGLVLWRFWLARRETREIRAQQVHIIESLDVLCRAVEQKQVELEEQRRQAAHAQILFVDLEQQLKVANSKLVQQQWKKRQEGRKQRIQHVKSIDRKKSNLQARQSSGETSEFPFVEVNDDR